MSKVVVLMMAVAIVYTATIPASMFDSGIIQIAIDTSVTSVPSTVTFSKTFATAPTVAPLLTGLIMSNGVTSQGFEMITGVPTTSGVVFNLTNLVAKQTIASLQWTWVATVGEHLQLFPITVTVPRDLTYPPATLDIPFDYPNKVQWSSGTFQVGITSLISSFLMASDSSNGYTIDITIAKWNGTDYIYSGDGSHYIMSNTALYGSTGSPFLSSGDVNVVKMYTGGEMGTIIRSYLLFHKVQLTGTVKTGYGVYRAIDHKMEEQFTFDISDPSFNLPITESGVVRFYGMESFSYSWFFRSTANLTFLPSNGISGICYQKVAMGVIFNRVFYGSYLGPASVTPPTPSCPSGCECLSGSTCTSCKSTTHRVDSPVSNACPCIAGYYEAADKTCTSCPLSSKCETCQLSGGSVVCLSCKCKNYRELNESGACVCMAGYHEDNPVGQYCLKNI